MFKALAAATALALAGVAGAPEAAAIETSPLIGRWTCVAVINGVSLLSHFEYQPNGRYVSHQQITFSPGHVVEGGGGGQWQLYGDILRDTKTEGRLDRLVRGGIEVPATDPQYQQLAAGAVANLGATTEVQIELAGDRMRAGPYTCERQP